MEDAKVTPIAPQPQTTVDEHLGLIQKANEAAERIEKANKEMDELLKKQELLLAEQRLQGRSFAGGENQPKKMTPEEYARAAMRGEVNPLAKQ